MNILPSEILKDAESAVSKLIPGKSKDRYLKEYELFQEWKKNRNVAVVTEDVMLAFFYQKSEVFKSSTLWSCFSLLKSTLNLYENIDISKYTKLTSFLKQNSVGYQPKKAKILTREQVDRFITDASDEKYLMIKVATLIGIAGACRREELHKMCIEDIEQQGSVLVVNLRNTKTNRPRVFTIVGDGVVNQIAIIKKYIALRPKKVTHNKLFLFYNKGKCSVQPVGIHTFAKMPKVIAEYLNLPDPNEYSGHCFRRTSATLLADSGADLTTLKRHGGWRSSSVAEGYIEDSIQNKIKIAKRIAVGEGSSSSLRTTVFEGDLSKQNSEAASAYRAELLNQNSDAAFVHGVTFSNLQSCTVNVNISK